MLLRQLILLKWVPIFFILVNVFSKGLCNNNNNNKYGMTCDSKDEKSCSNDNNLKCDGGTCKCFKYASPLYDENAYLNCVLTFNDLFYRLRQFECERTCGEHQDCIMGDCVCRKPFVGFWVDENIVCKKGVIKSPNETCSVQFDEAHVCNTDMLSYCKDSVCTCFEGYVIDESTGKCIVKKEEVKKVEVVPSEITSTKGLNGTTIKGLPGHKCVHSQQCVDGLICKYLDSVCACPTGCNYKQDEGACDCGAAELKTPSDVIIVGIALGFFSCFSWFYFIRKTYYKLKKKRENNFNNPANEEVELNSEDEDPQLSQTNRPISTYENKSSIINDPPPPYSSVVNNSNSCAIGFAPPSSLPSYTAPSAYSSVPPASPVRTSTSPVPPAYSPYPPTSSVLSNTSGPMSSSLTPSFPSVTPSYPSEPSPWASSNLTQNQNQSETTPLYSAGTPQLPYPVTSSFPTPYSSAHEPTLPYSPAPSTGSFPNYTSTSAFSPSYSSGSEPKLPYTLVPPTAPASTDPSLTTNYNPVTTESSLPYPLSSSAPYTTPTAPSYPPPP